MALAYKTVNQKLSLILNFLNLKFNQKFLKF